MSNIKIATWNISGGVLSDVSENGYFDQEKKKRIDESFLNEIIEIINEEKIDIISFQEIITTEDINYINKIKNNTNLKYSCYFELSECNLVKDTNCGIAILSKYPIIDIKKYKFKNPKLSKITSTGKVYFTYDKGCLLAKLLIDNREVCIITNHGFPFRRFNSTPEENIEVFRQFEEYILKFNNSIVTGDFNAENILELMPKLKITKDIVFDEITTSDGKKFDNIIIDKSIKCINKKIIKSLSDHYLCIAIIEI